MNALVAALWYLLRSSSIARTSRAFSVLLSL